MSLKQKVILTCIFPLLFSSYATIKENVKNDDVLLKSERNGVTSTHYTSIENMRGIEVSPCIGQVEIIPPSNRGG